MIDPLSFAGCFPFRYVCATPDEVAEALRRWGFERAVLASLNATAAKNPAEADRDFLRKLGGGFFIPAVVLNPEYPTALEDLEELAKEGAAVLLLPIPYQGFKVGSARTVALIKRGLRLGMAVVLSAALEDQRQYPRRIRLNSYRPKEVEEVVERVNDERLILSEFAYKEIAELAHKGAFSVDVGSRGIFGPPYDHLEALARTVGVSRLVAATYYPLKYPAVPLAKAALAGLDVEKIFVDNPRRLLGLG